MNQQDWLDLLPMEPSGRFHLSKKPIQAVTKVAQEMSLKPKGIWYGIGDSWREWAASEIPYVACRYTHLYRLELGGTIAKLSTSEAVDDFTAKYSFGDDWPWIAWEKVEKDFDGIEVFPYNHRDRFRYTWYYGLDAASGCVWNPDAVKIHLVSKV